MAGDVPFKYITGLPEEAQREIERNFLEVQKNLSAVSHSWYFLAANDASADEKARADYVFDGATDSAKLAAIFAAHPGGHFILSGGNFNLTVTLDTTVGVAALIGIGEAGGHAYDNTTINFNDNGVGGALTACDAGGALIILDVLYMANLDIQYNGALPVSAFLGNPATNSGSVVAEHVGFGNMLTVMGTTGGGNFSGCQLFAMDCYASLSGVGAKFSTENFPAGHRLINFRSRTGSISLGQLTQCIVTNPVKCTWTELAGGTNYILDSRGAANSFRGNATGATAQVLDISATAVPGLIGTDKNLLPAALLDSGPAVPTAFPPTNAPTGAAGGSLAGTYPNPTFAGRDASVDAINKDMLPSELGAPQSGITSFPPAATGGGSPTGAAGGSLSGTYPNPTFAGRDASVDAINKDLLPSALLDYGPAAPTAFPPLTSFPPSGAAGGSLAGTYPSPTFAGRDASVDAINKDLLPALLLDQGTPMMQAFPAYNYIPQDTIWVNVKDHGAKGDGVTDDTAAINAAITFANWPTNRAVIYFPAGTYLTTTTITLDGGGASSTPQIAFVGWGATITTTSVITMFTITNSISSVTRIHFQGLIIKPNATGAIGVSLKNAEFVTFNDCEFLGSGGTAITTIASSTSPYCGVFDCNFSNLASGIVFNGNADFFTISNCNFAEGLAGTGITGWIDVPVSTGSSNGVRITGCVFRGVSATQPVIQLKFAVNWTITGCAFIDSPQESIWLGVNGSCKNTSVTGCTFQKGLQNDITINGGRLNAVTGCLFGSRGAGVAASTYFNIQIKNTFGGAAGADNVVTGCTSEDTGTALAGFAKLDDGCVSCSFLGNFYSIKIVQGHAQPVIVDATLVQLRSPDEIDGMLGQPLGIAQFPPAGGSSPTGGAGGSLAGTYPNPTFAGRDASTDALNKDMLPSELGAPQSGVSSFPPASTGGGSPTGAAGGSLAGTYPNPTFAGRDTSTDAINKDLLPALLADASGPSGPVPFPPISPPTGAAGGSLAGTYPNPSFAGRDASVDAINKDMLPSQLAAPLPFGVSAFPYQPIPAAATDGVTITVTSGVLTLVFGGVGNTYLGVMAQNTIKGRVASGTGIVQDLTASQVYDVLRTTADYTAGFLLMGA